MGGGWSKSSPAPAPPPPPPPQPSAAAQAQAAQAQAQAQAAAQQQLLAAKIAAEMKARTAAALAEQEARQHIQVATAHPAEGHAISSAAPPTSGLFNKTNPNPQPPPKGYKLPESYAEDPTIPHLTLKFADGSTAAYCPGKHGAIDGTHPAILLNNGGPVTLSYSPC